VWTTATRYEIGIPARPIVVVSHPVVVPSPDQATAVALGSRVPAGRRAAFDKALSGVIHDNSLGRWRRVIVRAVPRQPRRCQTAVLIVFHLDRRVARQVDCAIVRAERLIVPLVNQQVTVYPQADTVVGRRRETGRNRSRLAGPHPYLSLVGLATGVL
jgi:hypothetical protein